VAEHLGPALADHHRAGHDIPLPGAGTGRFDDVAQAPALVAQAGLLGSDPPVGTGQQPMHEGQYQAQGQGR
jgi:hypothetical protein